MMSLRVLWLKAGAVANRKQFVAALHRIIEDHDILRLKGFVAIRDKPMRLVVQAVGNRIDHHFDRDWQKGEAAAVTPCGDRP